MSKIEKRAIKITDNLVLKPLFNISSEIYTQKPMLIIPTYFRVNISKKCAIIHLRKTRNNKVFIVEKIEFPKQSRTIKASKYFLILPKSHRLVAQLAKRPVLSISSF